MNKDVFFLLLSLAMKKGNTPENVLPTVNSLIIEKFNCKPDVFQKVYPFFFTK